MTIEKTGPRTESWGTPQAADRSRRQRQETCCMEMALARWPCRESIVVSVEWNLV